MAYLEGFHAGQKHQASARRVRAKMRGAGAYFLGGWHPSRLCVIYSVGVTHLPGGLAQSDLPSEE